MIVSQWNLVSMNSHISGLKRYDDEIFIACSKYGTVNRYYSKNNKLKTVMGYRKGDITHITTQQLAFLKSFMNVKNCVVTVHDLIPQYWYTKRRQLKELWVLNQLLLDRADFFIADSEHTRKDLLYNFNVNDDIVKTVYLGVDHSVFYPDDRDKCREIFHMDPDKVYAVSVSSGEPWKNTELLKKLPYEIIEIGYGRGKFGWATDDTVRALYTACDVFLAPSKHEGFGLPVLEAMACGCPVVASSCTSFPEVVGQGGLLVDPNNPESWMQAVDRILSARQKWSNRGIVNAMKFTWEKCGRETWKIYENMGG